MKKTLVVYYSWSNGNTKKIAEQLTAALGADLERLEPQTPYSGSYNDVVDQGQREVEEGYLPPLKPLTHNPADYDLIAAGTPTWWYTMAPCMRSFLQSQDWTGRTVVPFMTNGGWPGHVIADMSSLCKAGKVILPLEVQFDSNGGAKQITPQNEVDAWVRAVCQEAGK